MGQVKMVEIKEAVEKGRNGKTERKSRTHGYPLSGQ
jgi:hypothetical protein